MPSLSAWERGNAASLFDRIRGEERRSSPETEVEALIESVKRQLDNVLNTRPGNCRSAPELGVIDFNDATQGGADIRGKSGRRSDSVSVALNLELFMWMSTHRTIYRIRWRCRFRLPLGSDWKIWSRLPLSISIWIATATTE